MLSLNLPEDALSELLHADDFVLMIETIERSWIHSHYGRRHLRAKV